MGGGRKRFTKLNQTLSKLLDLFELYMPNILLVICLELFKKLLLLGGWWLDGGGGGYPAHTGNGTISPTSRPRIKIFLLQMFLI